MNPVTFAQLAKTTATVLHRASDEDVRHRVKKGIDEIHTILENHPDTPSWVYDLLGITIVQALCVTEQQRRLKGE